MHLTVLSDIHIGTLRSAGTTPASAYALRGYLLEETNNLLNQINTDLLINGDLFDKENIPLADLAQAISMFVGWLQKGNRLWLSPGNHDLAKNSGVQSSFQFFGKLLTGMRPDQVTYISDLTEIYTGIWVLPHLANQDLLNDRLAKVPACKVLAVHANYDNNFAQESDHSLNISKSQAEACLADLILFGHEHQTREALGGKVLIPGNQIPSSIADCLGCTSGTKFYTAVNIESGVAELKPFQALDFTEVDWKELATVKPTARFIRVTGQAVPDEGAQVAQVISRFRSTADAYVITNAVQMRTGEEQTEQFAQSLESVQAFDVLGALLEVLSEEEGNAVKELLNA